jgi:hypothetical protein
MAIDTNTTSSPTASLGFPGAKGGDLPPLAQYKPRSEYVPQYGDYIVWSRWFSCWHGVVTHFDKETREVHVIFAGVPFLLFTMSEVEQEKETIKLQLAELHGANNGKYSILQHTAQSNVWYI